MKIALYISTFILGFAALMVFAVGMESIGSEPDSVRPLFGICSVLVGVVASWWLCALSGAGLWAFVVRSAGFALCIYPLIILFCWPDICMPLVSILQMGVGCSLLIAAPGFAPVRLAQGFLSGVLLLVGVMGALGLVPGGLWGGIVVGSLGCALLLVSKSFSPFLLALNFSGSFIIIASLVTFTLYGDTDSVVTITLMTLGLIAGATFIVFPITQERSTQFKVVGRAGGRSLDDLYRAMKDCDTVLGTPWMCNALFTGRIIVVGPNADGANIYFAKFFGYIVFGCMQTTLALRPDSENAWRLERPVTPPQDRNGIWAYSLELIEFNTAMIESVQRYLAGEAFTAPPRGLPSGTIYTFDEDFQIVSQSFAMQTLDGKPLYIINAPLPFITFTIQDAISGKDVMVIKKRFLRMRQQYDFFWNGELYGTFSKKLDFIDDIFTMPTPDGLVTMQEVQGALGTNYTVRMDKVLIGSIASKLNPTLTNLVFDNYLIHVREERYAPLLAALGAMSAREQSRDRAETVRSWTS